MPENIFEIVVPQQNPKIRLDKYLVHELPHLSRSRIQQLIDEKKITINGLTSKANHIIKPGELIEISIPPPKKPEIIPQNIPLNIVHDDDYMIIIDKHAGMVVHPAPGNYDNTLVNALLYHCQNLSGINGVLRPGIVHRLDKETTGLLVVAKDDLTHRKLAEQFTNRAVKREYFAVVWGRMKEQSGQIESYLARNKKDRTKISVSKEGKVAITTYQVLEEWPICSFLKLNLKTGRTHQIRVHLSHQGRPVVGDPTYGGREKYIRKLCRQDRKTAIQMLKIISRQALHARSLGFIHPITQKFMYFESDLPADMQLLIQFIKQYSV